MGELGVGGHLRHRLHLAEGDPPGLPLGEEVPGIVAGAEAADERHQFVAAGGEFVDLLTFQGNRLKRRQALDQLTLELLNTALEITGLARLADHRVYFSQVGVAFQVAPQ